MKIKAFMGLLLMTSLYVFTGCNPTDKTAAPNTSAANVNAGPTSNASPARPNATTASAALPDNAFKASISVSSPPTKLKAGAQETINVKVKNNSDVNWPALGQSDYSYQVKLGDHWLDKDNKVVLKDDARADLPADIKPGTEAEIPINVNVPGTAGDYTLELDMVQEQVSWFALKGSTPFRAKVKVE